MRELSQRPVGHRGQVGHASHKISPAHRDERSRTTLSVGSVHGVHWQRRLCTVRMLQQIFYRLQDPPWRKACEGPKSALSLTKTHIVPPWKSPHVSAAPRMSSTSTWTYLFLVKAASVWPAHAARM